MNMNYKGHVLYTAEDFKNLPAEELDDNRLYDLVMDSGFGICKVCGEYEAGLDRPCTVKVEGQCFDCYAQATFQYHGQTAGFNELKMKQDYVAALKKPSTTVHCKVCDRTLRYTEQNGYWNTTICELEDGSNEL